MPNLYNRLARNRYSAGLRENKMGGPFGVRKIYVCLITVLGAACATRPNLPRTHAWALPCDSCVEGISNFAQVDENLWRGAQPDMDDPDIFIKLEKRGVKTVINPRYHHDDFYRPQISERQLVFTRSGARDFFSLASPLTPTFQKCNLPERCQQDIPVTLPSIQRKFRSVYCFAAKIRVLTHEARQE